MKPKTKRAPVVGAGVTANYPPLSSWDLKYCNNYTTPACLSELYHIPNGTADLSSFGIIDFVPENTYRTEDLKLYLETLTPEIPSDTAPVIELIDETTFVNATADLNEGETLLDISLEIALAYPQQITLITPPITTPDQDANDWILEAWLDEWPLQRVRNPKCRQHILGGDEQPENADAYERQCLEYLKLGLQGHSIIFVSRDNGVAGTDNGCCQNPGCAPQNNDFVSTDKTFLPGFLASCSWVTTVGATRIAEGASIDECEVVAFQNVTGIINGTEEILLEWTSGGGFRNVFETPDYQKDALRYYFDNFKPKYTSKQYNDSECTRGYPDVSANGVQILLVSDGEYSYEAGTSAATPIFASIITLINQERIKANRSPVGFLSPVI